MVKLETHQDFHGQGLAEKLYQGIIIVTTVVAFFVGYHQQDFKVTFQIWLAGFLAAFLVSLPPWPCFRRNPVKWIEKVVPSQLSQSSESSGEGSKKKR